MTLLRVSINRQIVRANAKTGEQNPPITVYRHNRPIARCHVVEFTGPSRVVYNPSKPLKCGARVYIETVHPIEVLETPL